MQFGCEGGVIVQTCERQTPPYAVSSFAFDLSDLVCLFLFQFDLADKNDVTLFSSVCPYQHRKIMCWAKVRTDSANAALNFHQVSFLPRLVRKEGTVFNRELSPVRPRSRFQTQSASGHI